MGEAGPEAVMPLHRGPDGSLGVKMSGGGGTTAVVMNINNYGNAKVTTEQRQTSNGIEIDVMIDDMVSKKIADQGSATNRTLAARDNRRMISR
jgi:phage-related minor tail protein